MASREEEKRRRREEREAAEAAAASSAKRTRNLQFLLGALLTIAVVVVVVLVVSGGGSDSGSQGKTKKVNEKTAAIPKAQEANLDTAAKAAGCVLLNPPIEGSSHVQVKVVYKTNPPSSGNHNPVPALDGIYTPGNEPTTEHLVHALEHGRINYQYAPGTSAHQISQLETLTNEQLNGRAGYKTLLYRNDTKMPYAVAATAWGHILGCKTFNDKVFDALRDFRIKYVDKGPEPGIPPNN